MQAVCAVRRRTHAMLRACACTAFRTVFDACDIPSGKLSMGVASMVMRVSPAKTLPLTSAGPPGITEFTCDAPQGGRPPSSSGASQRFPSTSLRGKTGGDTETDLQAAVGVANEDNTHASKLRPRGEHRRFPTCTRGVTLLATQQRPTCHRIGRATGAYDRVRNRARRSAQSSACRVPLFPPVL